MWFVVCVLRALKSHDCTFYAWFTLARKTENGIKQSAIFRRGKSWNVDVRIPETPPPPLSANVRKSITPPPSLSADVFYEHPLNVSVGTRKRIKMYIVHFSQFVLLWTSRYGVRQLILPFDQLNSKKLRSKNTETSNLRQTINQIKKHKPFILKTFSLQRCQVF